MFFFFKQKTSYEMRISDWSSDVCSSDLAAQRAGLHQIPALVRELDDAATYEIALVENIQRLDLNAIEEASAYRKLIEDFGHNRSEEHTSELQSLMRTSYAVVCLKKNTNTTMTAISETETTTHSEI